MTTFTNADELGEHMMNGAAWMSVVAADSWPYLITCTGDGDWFVQGFPAGAEEGDAFRGGPVESGTEWLEAKPETWWPVHMLADSETHVEGGDRG